MTEENGELARELNNLYGHRKKKDSKDTAKIGEEIADMMFNLICLANSHNIDLNEEWQKKMDKCYGRDKDRYKHSI
ncbi:MAG: MazG nucleotide pyrophosphohydrolase domain-containing protein [Candidatus Nanoarchaeia archaeon]|nr:MazG nucleotide pyrophosphohydrolase domain-containing protein [Candidatus Nanoarchaeia archaeon]